MIEFIAQNMAPIMFASLIIFLLIGYPVAFSLAANGLMFFFIGVVLSPYSGGSINLAWPLLHALPDNFYGSRVMSNDTLLAIPFFTFMGIVLERSGMAEDLLDTIGQLFGPVRGGLAYAVIFVGALLAATTGVVAASVIAMGLISLPIMLRYGYDRRLASGVIAASGTLAQIIPPSLVLIVLADQLGRSVGDMYAGALIPGLVLTGLYTLYILIMSIVRPNSMPALPLAARTLGHGVLSLLAALLVAVAASYAAYRHLAPAHGDNADILGASIGVILIYIVAIADKGLNINMMSRLAQQVIIVLIPPLALIFLVLGTIFLGIATPTEGGAMGAVGALAMAAMKGRLSLDVIKQALASTTLAPAADKLGIDLIWFGVLLGVNMQTSFMHPPFGFALFYLRSVAARVPYLDRLTGKQIAPVTTGQIYWGAVPFVCIQVIMIGLTIAFPQMVMRYKGAAVDPGTIEINLPDMPGLAPLGTPPPANGGPSPAAPPSNDLSQPPNFGETPPAKPAAPATDLSQPPNFN
ncbi:TRAP transporter large permease subunit [Mesorhizobium sp. LSHC440A00]|uniref:TRAP transporter large permease n=1 Tax=Mesorhizobium sp. LSHC440A00 TaxID=1287307 RepID=UPI0003CE3754|nr:TRAP transporter large permease subunit [Mesorhizobium sp. LSHC440A00]ESX40715.1 C4-dicarboxylate ABC transporter [Mesorhizobium sp. LSHC440A00]